MEQHFGWLEWAGVPAAYVHVATAMLVSLLLGIASLAVWLRTRRAEACIIPSERCTPTGMCDVVVNAIVGMMEDIIGPDAKRHLPLIGTVFLYILCSNLLGLVPGMTPSTANMNTNLAVGLVVFVYYNWMGIRAHGVVNYLKHFMGPVIWIAPLLFAIELFSHFIRPLTLSIRLFCNMVADHAVTGVFSDLVPLILPTVFMGLGVFICFIQAFVFSLLSMVYIALATAQEEHH
ncbi:MAG: F0F1 ATP synthase subunit A [Deltaproteobacteria bacterium]|nr:F0F1 ATP synthase subunit A [Deltaproteobacteria bacterium]